MQVLRSVPVDVYQGGAGTLRQHEHQRSALANIALELMGLERGHTSSTPTIRQQCQSTNDAYPTGFRVAVVNSTDTTPALEALIAAFDGQSQGIPNIS